MYDTGTEHLTLDALTGLERAKGVDVSDSPTHVAHNNFGATF